MDGIGIVMLALLAVGLGAAGAWVLARRGRGAAEQLTEVAQRLADAQAALAGRLSQMAESQAAAQTQLQGQLGERLQAQERAVTKMLDERLADVTRRVGENLQRASEKATETMGQLHERLAVIDAAQKNLTDLSAEMVSLQDILSNKQARGAIGQMQMEDLVRNMLPPRAFSFQATLSNGKRADCVIHLPNPPGMIVVDSKYPHEAFLALMNAEDERARTAAQSQFKTDVTKHIRDIAEKYIVPGETADSAIMFVPAQSVADIINDDFPGLIEEGFRRRVYIAAPNNLMLILNTVRAILKGAQVREQAHMIQSELAKLMEDVQRLDTRAAQLAQHFDQARKDVDQIRTSAGKILKRGEEIEHIPLEPPVPETAPPLLRQVASS